MAAVWLGKKVPMKMSDFVFFFSLLFTKQLSKACDIQRIQYQHAVIGSWLTGEKGKHDAEVGVLELQPEGAAHLPPQGGLLVGVARQRHGNHVQVQVTCGSHGKSEERIYSRHV